MKLLSTSALTILLATSAINSPLHAVEFPGPSRAWLDEGAFVEPGQVRLVRVGLTKSQVYPLLGAPHFSEGLGPRHWNYLLNFYTGSGSDYVTCQLQLHFEKGRVDSLTWREPSCVDRLNARDPVVTIAGPVAAIVEPVAVSPPRQIETVIGEFPVFFAFDRTELSPTARATIATAAARARTVAASKVIVIGAADRSGSDMHNLELSDRRAKAVAAALAEAGMPTSEPAAKGEYNLAIPTAEGVREPANRRVVITLIR